MNKPLSALILEDCESDAFLIVRELGRQGFDLEWDRVWTARAMAARLDARSWDVVLSDYNMPGFDAPAALVLLQETGQDIPFIVISGTVGEEAAVAAMKNGAHDYIMKGHLRRLGSAIERELRDAGIRREHRSAIDKIQHLNQVLRAIRNVNQLIVTEKDRTCLLKRAAEMLVETRGYSAALCISLDDTLHPQVAVCGPAEGQTAMERELAIRETGLTLCMKLALQSAVPVLIDEDTADCPNCPLHTAHSGSHRLARAIEHEGKALGVLSIALPMGIEPDAEELELIEEMAGDLGLALHGIAQAELLAEETTLAAAAINAMPDTFFLFDQSTGSALRWNDSFRDLSGYTDEEIALLPAPQSYYDEEDLQRAAAAVETIAREGKASVTLDLITKTGARVPCEYAGTSIQAGKDGEPLIIAIGRDITQRRSMLAQLAQSDRLASMGTLASGVAHEINNPTNIVMNCAELILEEVAPDGPAATNVRHIQDASDRISIIVKALLDFARRDDQNHSPANMADIVNSTVALVGKLLKKDQIRLVVDVPGDMPPVKCRSQRIQQVFMNLITNARDALNDRYIGYHENKTISIRSDVFDKDGEVWVRTTVEDCGTGIPEALRLRIFEPFFTTKSRHQGTGLGMSVSHGIVTEHKGMLSVESEEGNHTRIHMDLPVDNGWTLSSGNREDP